MRGVIRRALRSAHGHDLRSAFTASLSAFPALNDGNFEADIEIASPVWGLRPVRAARVLAANVPKPAIRTSSPFARALADHREHAVDRVPCGGLVQGRSGRPDDRPFPPCSFRFLPDASKPPCRPKMPDRPVHPTGRHELPSVAIPGRPNSTVPSMPMPGHAIRFEGKQVQ